MATSAPLFNHVQIKGIYPLFYTFCLSILRVLPYYVPKILVVSISFHCWFFMSFIFELCHQFFLGWPAVLSNRGNFHISVSASFFFLLLFPFSYFILNCEESSRNGHKRIGNKIELLCRVSVFPYLFPASAIGACP